MNAREAPFSSCFSSYLSLSSLSHSTAEEAEATVQGERGGQKAQTAQSPQRGNVVLKSRSQFGHFIAILAMLQDSLLGHYFEALL